MSSFFIKHPTIAIVISIVMILLGGLSLMGLPIEQYPNIVPPTINVDNQDPECDLDCVPNKARETRVDAVLSNSFGFGGHNSSVIVKRFA